MSYKKLVMSRVKLHFQEKNTKKADFEFNRMLKDLLSRHVKYSTITSLIEEYEEAKITSRLVSFLRLYCVTSTKSHEDGLIIFEIMKPSLYDHP